MVNLVSKIGLICGILGCLLSIGGSIYLFRLVRKK